LQLTHLKGGYSIIGGPPKIGGPVRPKTSMPKAGPVNNNDVYFQKYAENDVMCCW